MSNENNAPEDRIEDLEQEIEEVEQEIEDAENDDTKSEERVYTKADVEKAARRRQTALKKARDLEKELRELKAQHETDNEKLTREAAEKAAAKAEATYKPALVQKELHYQLATLGLKKDQIPALIQLFKMDEIEIDEEFNVLGVEDEISRIKSTFPQLFVEEKSDEDKAPVRKRRVPNADAGDRPKPETKTKSSAEIARDRFLKRG